MMMMMMTLRPFNNLFKHALPPETPGTAPGKRIAVIIWANEQDMVPRMVREKNPGMRHSGSMWGTGVVSMTY